MSESQETGAGANVLLQVRDLKKFYPVKKGFLRRVIGQVRAVDGVTFDIFERETLGLVGESGCGKTTVAKTILRAVDPTAGELRFDGENGVVDVARLRGRDLKQVRRSIQMIFQDPYASLNPRHRIRDIIGEPLLVNHLASGKQLEARVAVLMEQVGLRPEYAIRYPHAFSGGQRQRIGIARALAHHPRLLRLQEALFDGPVLPHPRNIARLMIPRSTSRSTPPHQDFVHVQGTPRVWTVWIPPETVRTSWVG